MVKIAICSQTPDGLEAITDMRFGRCPFYTFVEVDGKNIRNVEVAENPAVTAFGGAGIQAAQFMANQGVKAVIAGNYGPNAYGGLSSLGIEMLIGPIGVTVKEAVEQYISGSITSVSGATGPAHMGMGMGGGRGMGMGGGRGMGMGGGRGMGMGGGRGMGMGVGAPPSPVAGGVKYCPYCGAQTPPDARFCPQCGKSLE